MEGGGAFTANAPTMAVNVDYDFMDLLLDEGGWLQTTEAPISLPMVQSNANNALMGYTHPESKPSLQTNSIILTSTRQPSSFQEKQEEEEMERWELPDSAPLFRQTATKDLSSQPQHHSAIQIVKSPGQTRNFLWEGNDLNRIWIAPEINPGSFPTSIKDRLNKAIWYFKEINRDREMLIQIWLPVRRGNKSYLSTAEQPYFHDPSSTQLINYRYISENYQFSAEEESKETLGMPGRVFIGKVPEWTPDVQFFRQDEYLRVGYARMYDVRGSIALPIFERGSGNCLGVVEIVTTKQKVTYHPEVESICKALEAVDLRSSSIASPTKEKIPIISDAYEATLPTIHSLLRIVCDKHDLPLAQTWVPCIQQGKDRGWHSEKDGHCASTVGSACYVRDPRIRDFHEACSEQHLLRGQGVVGKAFMTNQPCFATDTTAFTKADYPLSHHAKIFELRGAVAIRIISIYSDLRHYVLEFFLPSYHQETNLTLHSRVVETLSMLIQQSYRNLRYLTVEDLNQQQLLSDKETSSSSSDGKRNQMNQGYRSPVKNSQEETSRDSNKEEAQEKGIENTASLFREDSFNLTTNWGDTEEVLPNDEVFPENDQQSIVEGAVDSSFWDQHAFGVAKSGERKKTKAQKSISLQELRQYFAGSLKDAAKEIGVCPTTLKRICRQHGIARWPSRKIKKVGHSLKKLQKVIDSVKGAEGSIQLSDFYNSFPELNSSHPSSNRVPPAMINVDANNLNTQAEGAMYHSGANTSKSQSPTSQNSTSSHSFSTGANAATPMAITTVENPGVLLKRVNEAVAPTLLEKSQSSKSQGDNPSIESAIPPLPRGSGSAMRDGGALKVKVTLGEEKVRFSIAGNMGFRDLQQEIARRFGIDDVNKIHIKYLDDDQEWVLLTCDSDLDECIDIQGSSGSYTIKLCVHRAHPTRSGSFNG